MSHHVEKKKCEECDKESTVTSHYSCDATGCVVTMKEPFITHTTMAPDYYDDEHFCSTKCCRQEIEDLEDSYFQRKLSLSDEAILQLVLGIKNEEKPLTEADILTAVEFSEADLVITITGEANSGKTSAAILMGSHLQERGATVKIKDPDVHDTLSAKALYALSTKKVLIHTVQKSRIRRT